MKMRHIQHEVRHTERTHALRPQTHKLGMGRRPSSREHSIKRAGESLDNREPRDSRNHRPKRDSREARRRKMANEYNGDDEQQIFRDMYPARSY